MIPAKDKDDRGSAGADKKNAIDGDAKANECSPGDASTSSQKRHSKRLHIPVTTTTTNDARVIMQSLPSWVAGASPAKFISVEELMNMSTALQKMSIAHEIAVNPSFMVEEPPSNDLVREVRKCMQQAYWDKLKEDLSNVPPDYSCLLLVLDDIKKMIFELLLPQNERFRAEVDAILDLPLLKQQIEQKCLNMKKLFEDIVGILSQICASIRDESIVELRKKTDTVDQLRGICELIDAMKIDLANFYVRLYRSVIAEHSPGYERDKYMKLLEKDKQLEFSTLEWLKRHLDENVSDTAEPASKRRFEDLDNKDVNKIINNAYMDLLEWDDCNTYPSTLKMDQVRLDALAEKYMQLIVCACSVFMTTNLAGKVLAESKDFKPNLKNEIIVITNDINKSNMKQRLERIYVLCDDRVKKRSEELNISWSKQSQTDLKNQIADIISVSNHIKCLVRDRIRSFILSMISSPESKSQLRIPLGLSIIHSELLAFTAQFVRIINHNRQTFGAYYGQLIEKLTKT